MEHPEFFISRASSLQKSERIYLNDQEIDKICDLDLSDTALDNVRHYAIVSLRTGLRVSDFLKLNAQNIKGGYIEVQTQKTGHKVIVPLHAQLKKALDKRGGLPQRISDQRFNGHFKEVCKASVHPAKEGRLLMNPKTKT